MDVTSLLRHPLRTKIVKEMERLKAENERFRVALIEIASRGHGCGHIAQTALSEQDRSK